MTATNETTKTPRKSRRTAAAPEQAQNTRTASRQRRTTGAAAPAPETKTSSKLDLIVGHLTRPEGASLAELVAATGWQAHSVRGALAGSLKKKGHAVISEKVDGERRYRIGAAQ